MAEAEKSSVLYRNIHSQFPALRSGKGINLTLEDGREIIDGSGGAAVACIGHGAQRVKEAIVAQLDKVAYCSTLFYTSGVCEQLCRELVSSTQGQMSRAYIVSSGSEAMEAAMKLARQYFLEKEPQEWRRTKFIARRQSYHGTTIGSLSMGGHVSRRQKFEPMLLRNISRVSPCFSYRGQDAEETTEQYVARLAKELDDEFQRLGPETVCAFVAEPVVGAALGCVPSVPGYFRAVRSVCDKYGALLILDEVMCGVGRTGTLHAWQQEGVVPDIQTLGKCLGGGYQPIAAVLAGHKVVEALNEGSGAFVHGHTYQGHPIACAAALEVLKIIREENLVENVRRLGPILGEHLTSLLTSHPNVGDIRGRGFFWGIEFVANKADRSPFPVTDNVAMGVAELGLTPPHGIAVYPGSGTADGIEGDHIIVSPPYNLSEDQILDVAQRVKKLIVDYFAKKQK